MLRLWGNNAVPDRKRLRWGFVSDGIGYGGLASASGVIHLALRVGIERAPYPAGCRFLNFVALIASLAGQVNWSGAGEGDDLDLA